MYPKIVETASLTIKPLPPRRNQHRVRVVKSARMVAVPVDALVDAVVEADEDDPGRAELGGEVDGLEA